MTQLRGGSRDNRSDERVNLPARAFQGFNKRGLNAAPQCMNWIGIGTRQAFWIMQQEIKPFVFGKAPCESQGQDIGVQDLLRQGEAHHVT
jgi:hypothetical protein